MWAILCNFAFISTEREREKKTLKGSHSEKAEPYWEALFWNMVKAEWDGGRCRVGPREVGCREVVVVVEGVVWHHFDHIFSLNPHNVKHVIWILDFAKNKKKGTHNWSVDSSDWKMTIQMKSNSAMTKAEKKFCCLPFDDVRAIEFLWWVI